MIQFTMHLSDPEPVICSLGLYCGQAGVPRWEVIPGSSGEVMALGCPSEADEAAS